MRAIVTFEVVGKPANHIVDALDKYIENIKKDHRIILLKEEREEPIEHEDGMFSTFCEAELLAKGLETFTWLCINFSPASIEILEPGNITIQSRNITNWLNDLLAQIHEIGMNYRKQKAGNEHLTIAMNTLIKNSVLLSLKQGVKSEREIEKETGIYAEQLVPFLEHLTKKGEIITTGNKYGLPDPLQKQELQKNTTQITQKIRRKK